jgi:hypothetical protein
MKAMRKILLLVFCLVATPVLADCMRDASGNTFCGEGPCAEDSKGQVFCAPAQGGTALINDAGDVVCGYGRCQTGPYGGNYCAIEPGGDATRSERGEIECVGGCEAATNNLCQRTPALSPEGQGQGAQ